MTLHLIRSDAPSLQHDGEGNAVLRDIITRPIVNVNSEDLPLNQPRPFLAKPKIGLVVPWRVNSKKTLSTALWFGYKTG